MCKTYIRISAVNKGGMPTPFLKVGLGASEM